MKVHATNFTDTWLHKNQFSERSIVLVKAAFKRLITCYQLSALEFKTLKILSFSHKVSVKELQLKHVNTVRDFSLGNKKDTT